MEEDDRMARPIHRSHRLENPRDGAVRFVIAVLLIALPGCASQGSASSAPDSAGGATAPSTTSDAQTTNNGIVGGGGSSDTTLPACDLLPPEQLAKLDVTPEESSNHPGTCRWHEENSLHMVGVTHATDLTMDAIEANQDVTPVTLGSREGMQYESENDSCLVAIELPDSTVVLNIGVAPGNVEKSCKLAKKTAKAVAPNLP
jgi:Protein of unknown function (DUF3558)